MRLLTGKEVAQSVYEEIAQIMKQNPQISPTLAVVLVGDDPASVSYVEGKKKACVRLGFGHRDYHLPSTTDMQTLLELIHELNGDPHVHGILVQSPLPEGLDEQIVTEAISPKKDVDGFHPVNVGKTLLGLPSFVSCTPYGVLKMLDYYHIGCAGKHVVIMGRSHLVGKPLASLLMQKGRDATVTVCHSRTADLEEITKTADILMVAIGRPCFVTSSMVKEGAVVIDIGINRVDDATQKKGYRLVGDVDFDEVAPKCSAITPVPGGVGVMTIAMLMRNTLQAALQ
ncbi:MAG: bifunctional 5,10-methylenetetrahydrofolate dehydrogenase/5,10-methenyltetrahydrofolate cyclohydrolase [Sphaerochaetaceae bacterium]